MEFSVASSFAAQTYSDTSDWNFPRRQQCGIVVGAVQDQGVQTYLSQENCLPFKIVPLWKWSNSQGFLKVTATPFQLLPGQQAPPKQGLMQDFRSFLPQPEAHM